ncbi:MAG: hypothetical protein H7318_02400 [Oligoflexus sp.]|nr:hypothetical protein [Oligoflexus sp.]
MDKANRKERNGDQERYEKESGKEQSLILSGKVSVIRQKESISGLA